MQADYNFSYKFELGGGGGGGKHRIMAEQQDCGVCDFNFLNVGHFLSCPDQASKLRDECGFESITATDWDNENAAKDVNVFDTANPTAEDFDLGAPHSTCGGDARVDMIGGRADGLYPNCFPQGKALVIQDPDSPQHVPDDYWRGGCLIFDFGSLPYHPTSLGILDIDASETMTIEVRLE